MLDVKVFLAEFCCSVDTAETGLLIAHQHARSVTVRRPDEVTTAADRRPQRLDVMQWLAANGQPGLPGETPGALAAVRARNFASKTLLVKRYFSKLTSAHSST